MSTHLIEALLPGPLGLDLDLVLTLNLPIVLRPISRVTTAAAPSSVRAGARPVLFPEFPTSPS